MDGRPVTGVLEKEALLAEARRRTGLADFGDPAFRAPLRELLRSLREEARLSQAGRAMQLERIVGLLVNRLRTEEHVRRHPEIARERIGRPLVIAGLARTGTTLLHRTLAADPRWFALRWYESRNPAPFPEADAGAADPDAPDPRIADAEAEVAAMLDAAPDLLAAHPMDAHAPDEEIMLVEHAFTSWNPEAFCRVPGYAAWLERQDPVPGYRYLRRLLQFLQWQKRRRGEERERWVLKAPFHLGHVDALFHVFPDAQVVMTHRDPVQTVPSLASLVRTLHALGSDAVDPLEIGRHWSAKLARALEGCIAARARREERFLDVDYADLVADPMAQVRRIHDFAGETLDAGAEARMSEWAVENERDRRPVHRYTLEEFGFTEEGLRAQFAAYCERFPALRSAG